MARTTKNKISISSNPRLKIFLIGALIVLVIIVLTQLSYKLFADTGNPLLATNTQPSATATTCAQGDQTQFNNYLDSNVASLEGAALGENVNVTLKPSIAAALSGDSTQVASGLQQLQAQLQHDLQTQLSQSTTGFVANSAQGGLQGFINQVVSGSRKGTGGKSTPEKTFSFNLGNGGTVTYKTKLTNILGSSNSSLTCTGSAKGNVSVNLNWSSKVQNLHVGVVERSGNVGFSAGFTIKTR